MSVPSHVIKSKAALLSLFGLVLFTGVGALYYTNYSTAAEVQTPPAPPAPTVEVATVQPESIRIWTEFSGRIEAVERVEVRPRVSGAIAEILFEEGSVVKKGDPLFIIDPRPYQADLAGAEAALESARSRAELARDELRRLEGLVEKKAVSKSLYDTALSDYKVAAANISGARANLQQARLNLEYAHIQAPVTGLISRAEITVGNVIQAGPNAPVLTTIVANDEVFAEFDVDEQSYVNLVRRNGSSPLPVELRLSVDPEVAYRGAIHSFDNRLDSRSGTIRARALFTNRDRVLVPGMYANIRLGSATAEDQLLVDDRAVGTNQDQKFVYVVAAGSKIAYRQVKLGNFVDGKRVVLSGLQTGDRIVVNNLQRIRPEMIVQAVELKDEPQLGPLAMN